MQRRVKKMTKRIDVKRIDVKGMTEEEILALKYLAKELHFGSMNQLVLSQLRTAIKVGGLDITDAKLEKKFQVIAQSQLEILKYFEARRNLNNEILEELKQTQEVLENWIGLVVEQAVKNGEEK